MQPVGLEQLAEVQTVVAEELEPLVVGELTVRSFVAAEAGTEPEPAEVGLLRVAGAAVAPIGPVAGCAGWPESERRVVAAGAEP